MRIMQRLDDRLGQMGEVMSRAGSVFDEAHGYTLESSMRTAIWRCLFCRKSDLCRAWLETAPSGEAVPDFCPNAGFLAQYRQTEPSIRREAGQPAH